jgi:hypothetical protein
MAALFSIEANAAVLECTYDISGDVPRTTWVHDVSEDKGWGISDTTFARVRKTELG